MKLTSLSMIKKNFEIGDSVSIYCNKTLLVKGIVYIFGEIPIGRFYEKIYNTGKLNIEDDVYENALVIIDDNNTDQLAVLTLNVDEMKFFIWNDLFDDKTNFNYRQISSNNHIEIFRNEVTLNEMQHTFK